jgi:hypothetical protein
MLVFLHVLVGVAQLMQYMILELVEGTLAVIISLVLDEACIGPQIAIISLAAASSSVTGTAALSFSLIRSMPASESLDGNGTSSVTGDNSPAYPSD